MDITTCWHTHCTGLRYHYTGGGTLGACFGRGRVAESGIIYCVLYSITLPMILHDETILTPGWLDGWLAGNVCWVWSGGDKEKAGWARQRPQ